MMAFDQDIELDDASLLAQVAAGNQLAARALTTRLGPKVYGHAYRLLGNTAEAEDCTQDAMMRLWKIAPDWDPERARVTTWLYKVTANLCLDRLRQSKRRSSDEVPDVEDDAPSVAEQLQNKARGDALQDALNSLPDRQKQAVVLRHIENLANPEIAEIMEISVDAVESLTARGKRALATFLAPQKAALGYTDGVA